jgi:hypothetical protein
MGLANTKNSVVSMKPYIQTAGNWPVKFRQFCYIKNYLLIQR